MEPTTLTSASMLGRHAGTAPPGVRQLSPYMQRMPDQGHSLGFAKSAAFFSDLGSGTASSSSSAVHKPTGLRDLGSSLASEAWASADRLLLCLCMRAWRLHGRSSKQGVVKPPRTPPLLQKQSSPGGEAWSEASGITVERSAVSPLSTPPGQSPAPCGVMGAVRMAHMPAPFESHRTEVPAWAWPQPEVKEGPAVGQKHRAELDPSDAALLRKCVRRWNSEASAAITSRVKLENANLKKALRSQAKFQVARQRCRTGELVLMRLTWQAWEELTAPQVLLASISPRHASPMFTPAASPQDRAAWHIPELPQSPLGTRSASHLSAYQPPSPVKQSQEPSPLAEDIWSTSVQLQTPSQEARQPQETPSQEPHKLPHPRKSLQEAQQSQKAPSQQLPLPPQNYLPPTIPPETHQSQKYPGQHQQQSFQPTTSPQEPRQSQKSGGQPQKTQRTTSPQQPGIRQISTAASWGSLSLVSNVSASMSQSVFPRQAADPPGSPDLKFMKNSLVQERNLRRQILELKEQLAEARSTSEGQQTKMELEREALMAEMAMQRETFHTQMALQRAYLQAELDEQKSRRQETEKRLEALRLKSAARADRAACLRTCFKAWVTITSEVVEAASIFGRLPPPSPHDYLDEMMRDAREACSFLENCEMWGDDIVQEDMKLVEAKAQATVAEQVQIAKQVLEETMEEANDMWESVQQRIDVVRNLTTQKFEQSERYWLLHAVFASWARSGLIRSSRKLAVNRLAEVLAPHQTKQVFAAWRAVFHETTVHKNSRAALATFIITADLDLQVHILLQWQQFAHQLKRDSIITHRYCPRADSCLMQAVLLAWFVLQASQRSNRISSTGTASRKPSKDSAWARARQVVSSVQAFGGFTHTVSPSEAPQVIVVPAELQSQPAPQPHPVPEAPVTQGAPAPSGNPAVSRNASVESMSASGAAAKANPRRSATKDPSELQDNAVTQAVEKALSALQRPMIEVTRMGADKYKIGETVAFVLVKGDQVTVKKGVNFVPMESFLRSMNLDREVGSISPARSAAGTPRGSVTPGNVTPRGSSTGRQSSIATGIAAALAGGSASATPKSAGGGGSSLLAKAASARATSGATPKSAGGGGSSLLAKAASARATSGAAPKSASGGGSSLLAKAASARATSGYGARAKARP
eukprot:TRINITY_DN9221_c0_g1_i2.p1 TRINITY_DN9221_c0_g1~~TRINITY_DN9221_c0_g1_i2.p1  ORF type:complete len:1156 (+),score=225.48 TRINITY_DN9221_c0_g1_i2:106-3573(+)